MRFTRAPPVSTTAPSHPILKIPGPRRLLLSVDAEDHKSVANQLGATKEAEQRSDGNCKGSP
jgi:hypothetical protein